MQGDSHSAAGSYSGQERRAGRRYQISTSAFFEWQTQQGNWRQGTGQTVNVGARGAFVFSAAAPPAGAPIHLELTVHPGWNDELDVRLCGEGQVRHVREINSTGHGFGACASLQIRSPDGL